MRSCILVLLGVLSAMPMAMGLECIERLGGRTEDAAADKATKGTIADEEQERDDKADTAGKSITLTASRAGLTVDAGPDQAATADQAIMLTATVTGGTAPYSYLWTFKGGPEPVRIGGATTQTATAICGQPGTYTFEVAVGDAKGGATGPFYKDTVIVTVMPNPASGK